MLRLFIYQDSNNANCMHDPQIIPKKQKKKILSGQRSRSSGHKPHTTHGEKKNLLELPKLSLRQIFTQRLDQAIFRSNPQTPNMGNRRLEYKQ